MDQAPLYTSTRSLMLLMAVAVSCPFVQANDYGAVGASTAEGTSIAGYGYYGAGQSDIQSRAFARREARVNESMDYLNKGREYYRAEKYEESLQEYRRALDTIPKAPVTQERVDFIKRSIGDASVALAQQYVKVGRYDEARQLLLDALKTNPCNKLAQRELEYMNDPIRTNPAKTPQYVKDVEEVNKLLHMGYGYFDLGQFDEAKREFQKVLRIDKYNTAARRGMEQVDKRRSAYYRSAYDQARAEALAEVDRSWEVPVPMEVPEQVDSGESITIDANGATANLMKLKSIIIPSVNFDNTTVEEAIEFLRNKSVQLDTGNGERGINFVINNVQPAAAAPATPSLDDDDFGGDDDEDEDSDDEDEAAAPVAATPAVSTSDLKSKQIQQLKLRNVPMLEVLKIICQNAGLRYKVEDYAVTIMPAGNANDADLYSRTFSVPPNFISSLDLASGDSGGGDADPFGDGGGSSSGIKARPPVATLLKNAGVPFPEGASATYIAGNSSLIVRNTTANLDMIEQLIEQTKGKTKQIKIMTKFVEITQENTDELSFDWVVTPFSANDSRSLFVGGGTSSSSDVTSSNFVSAPTNTSNWPISSSSDTINGYSTSGLRSGTQAISKNGIENLLSSQNRTEATTKSPAPGILSMTGIYDEGSFQMLMRGLSQKKGTDVLTAPSITAKPGEMAKIEIIREFIYPTAYDAPQIPSSMGSNYDNNSSSSSSTTSTLLGTTIQPKVNSYPVTPATPTEFQMRPVGVTLEVQPNVDDNDFAIEMVFKPEISEFEGFVNYGSPIQSTGVGSDGTPITLTLTDNRIEQPIFSIRRVETNLSIYDGHTVAIGGLIQENVQIVEDKVPIFGDLPFVGRFFRSNSENHLKKNLMIFVTGQVIDATGQPVRGRATGSALDGDPASTAMSGDSVLPSL
jgi:general secretion pathway protein D